MLRGDLVQLGDVARADPLAGDFAAVAERVELETRHPRTLPRLWRSVQQLSRRSGIVPMWADGRCFAKIARMGLGRQAITLMLFRATYGTTGRLGGHAVRYVYNVGPLTAPVQGSSHLRIAAREIVELSRDVALTHVGAFVAVLQSLP
jgi:hypothetical protein